jgi:hypothetical protein
MRSLAVQGRADGDDRVAVVRLALDRDRRDSPSPRHGKMSARRDPTLTDLSAWKNASRIEGDLLDEVETQKADRDVVIIGSASVVHALARQDRVDEYRISLIPTILRSGTRLIETGAQIAGSSRRLRRERSLGVV